MNFEELNDEQKAELKQSLLMERNDKRGEGTSYEELSLAASLVSDEDLKERYGDTVFSPDDFACSATQAFRVRVTWSVHKTFQVPAASKEEALERMRRKVDAGEVNFWDSGWEADDGKDEPRIALEEG